MRVLQFGGGNFLRGFFDWMLQRIENSGAARYEVIVARTIPREDCSGLVNAGRYQVLSRGFDNATYRETVDEVRVIKGTVDPFADFESFLAEGRRPDLALIVSNTTEAGIFFDEKAARPHNYASFLAALIEDRAARGLPAPIVMPLELIDNNAETLRGCVEAYGNLFGYDAAFFDYLGKMKFLRTLPDRIIPGYPKDAAERINQAGGWEDKYMTSGELFHLLVIKSDASFKTVLPFDKAGLNIILAEDRFAFYRDRKVRVLNGCHTASVAHAMDAGLEKVDSFVSDKRFGEWLYRLAHEEIVPTLERPDNDLVETHRYADDVIQRFKNPALGHSFRSISLNSISKCRTRLEPTLIDYDNRFGKPPVLLSAAIANLVRMYRRGPVVAFPGGDLELRDYAEIKDLDTRDCVARFLPNAGDRLIEAIVNEL